MSMQSLSCPDSMSSHVSKVTLHTDARTHHALVTCMHIVICVHMQYIAICCVKLSLSSYHRVCVYI